MNRFDHLSNDMIVYIALTMDLPEILTYCRLSKRFNRLVCEDPGFWFRRLERDYGITPDRAIIHPRYTNPKSYYQEITNDFRNVREDLFNQLRVAIDYGMVDRIKNLIENKGVPPTGYHLLYVRDLDIAKYLVSKGADPTYVHPVLSSPVTMAAARGYLDLVKFYFENPNIIVRSGYVSGAAAAGHVDVLEFLNSQGPDQSGKNIVDDSYAFQEAVRYDQLEVVKYFMDMGHQPRDYVHSIASPRIKDYLLSL